MPKSSVFRRTFDAINKTVEVISVAILVMVTIVVIYSVLLRYVFRSPLEWSEEIARYMFIWMVFLGISVAERTGDHFRIDVLVELIPAKVRIFTEIVLNALIFYGLIVLFIQGMNYYEQGKRGLSAILEMPLNYIYIALPLSMVLTILNRIETVHERIVSLLSEIRSGRPVAKAESQGVEGVAE